MLAKILAERHGFKCTVLFAINPADGTIDPLTLTNMPAISALDSADLCVMGLRFRELPDPQMKHFADYLNAGKPIIALRTSTHAFKYDHNKTSPYAKYDWYSPKWAGGFGQQTFRIVYLWLSYVGMNVDVKPIVQAFVPVSSKWFTNIYTVYQSCYLDFGMTGVVILQLLFGLGHGILYRRATVPRPRAVWVMLFALSFYPLLLQATTDMYLSNLSNWVNFGIICMLIFGVFGSAKRKGREAIDRLRRPKGNWRFRRSEGAPPQTRGDQPRLFRPAPRGRLTD